MELSPTTSALSSHLGALLASPRTRGKPDGSAGTRGGRGNVCDEGGMSWGSSYAILARCHGGLGGNAKCAASTEGRSGDCWRIKHAIGWDVQPPREGPLTLL